MAFSRSGLRLPWSRHSGSASGSGRHCSMCRSSSSIASATRRSGRPARPPRRSSTSIWHQSRLDPALMLSLLPEQTLHILDEGRARSPWLEPWRELARTIAFNAEHVFVSRRLVRVLKGKGRLAVYLPDACRAGHQVVPAVPRRGPHRHAGRCPHRADLRRRRAASAVLADAGREGAAPLVSRALSISALPPMTIAELVERDPADSASTAANALFDRVAEARLCGGDLDRSLFLAIRDAADRFGPSHPIVEDVVTGSLSYRKLFIGARVLGRRFDAMTAPARRSACCCPTPTAWCCRCSALLSAGRVAAMINYTAGPGQRHGCGAHGRDPHRRFVARLHRQGRPRRHRRGGRRGRREARLAGGCARQRQPCSTSSLRRLAVALAAAAGRMRPSRR